MSELCTEHTLGDLILPASHNSATKDVGGLLLSRWARCQKLSVAEQLNIGVRMLDLRVADDVIEDDLCVTHRFAGGRLLPELMAVKTFLDRNPGEVVVLRIERDHDRKLQRPELLREMLRGVFGHQIVIEPSVSTPVKDFVRKNTRLILSAKELFCEEVKGRSWFDRRLLPVVTQWELTCASDGPTLAANIAKLV